MQWASHMMTLPTVLKAGNALGLNMERMKKALMSIRSSSDFDNEEKRRGQISDVQEKNSQHIRKSAISHVVFSTEKVDEEEDMELR